MHRYREFGLISDEDELLRRAFRDGFKRAELSFAQHLEALAWYRDHVRASAGGDELVAAFCAFAADRGWSAHQRDGALDIYRAIRDKGAAAVIAPPPPIDADRATLAEGDRLLRTDPARYWRDAELQEGLFEARERLGAAPGSEASDRARQSTPDRERIEEIAALLRDPSGNGQRRYWNDGTLRAEYTQALARVHGDATNQASDRFAPVVPIAAPPVETTPVEAVANPASA
jgi:hypothetical protein